MKGRLEGGKKEAGKVGGKEGRGGGGREEVRWEKEKRKGKREDGILYYEIVNSRRRGKYSESCGNYFII